MILIADSGSTKTDWALVRREAGLDGVSHISTLKTQGLNPFHQGVDAMTHILNEELLPQLDANEVDVVYFYGSGVRPELEPQMCEILSCVFPHAKSVKAHSDLLGAAHALCRHTEGIACILGTGASSCLFDGERIVQSTPALGYILGDEGSGAVLGRLFLNALYKGVLSEKIKDDFENSMGLTMPSVIDRVYRQPLANRFLASLSEFIHHHITDEAVKALVVSNFEAFFSRNIKPYRRPELPVSFVGSIAYYYQQQLSEAAHRQHFRLGTIIKSPLEGLVESCLATMD